MPPERLSPGRIAAGLFGLAPDRDERAPQLCQEALLTLARMGYAAPPGGGLRAPPKLERFALRSLALGVNFLAGRDEGRAGEDLTPQHYGELLARGEELRGSANLRLAREVLQGLVDPDTRKGQPGGWLLLPFHESLLWYDARRQGSGGRWGVRRVWMRGGGITLARFLADPPGGGEARALGASAVAALRETLQAESPLADIARQLELPLGEDPPPGVEAAEGEAWSLGGEERMADLAARVCRHAEGVMRQGGASGPARVWQLRSVLALDIALHALRTAWEATGARPGQRFLLLSFGGPPRADNRVRQRSEDSLNSARIRVQEAMLAALSRRMAELAGSGALQWQEEFVSRRDRLARPIERLRRGEADFESIAREVVAEGDYARPVGGFLGLLQTAGLIASTGQYRYLAASAELLPALVGALSARMPMPSDEFFEALFEEWGLVVGQRAATRTDLAAEIDGAELERNARRAEQRLSDSGLALALSDRTTVVGERASRAG